MHYQQHEKTSYSYTYFENKEPHIICNRSNKPIRSTIFNFNKLVADLDIHTKNPDSLDCKSSKFCYQPAGRIITGNLKIISDLRIRCIIAKVLKYRLTSLIDFNKCREEIAVALNEFCKRWRRRENVKCNAFNSWKLYIFNIKENSPFTLTIFVSYHLNPKLSIRHLKQGIH